MECEYMLVDTGGHYDTIYDDNDNDDDEDDNREEVWSDYQNRNIYEDDAKWCEFGQDWVETNVCNKSLEY